MQQVDSLDDLQLVPDSTPPLEVWLRCTACNRRGRYALERAFLAPPDPELTPTDDDGFYVPEILDCKHCGAADTYELSDRERLQLTTEATIGRMFGFGNPRLVLARTHLFDGTLVTRATAALAHLRALAEAQPGDGSLWRRLGNFQERIGLFDEAWESWLHAFTTDDRELEAGYALAHACLYDGDAEQAATIAEQALTRLPGCSRDSERFEVLVEGLLQLVHQHAHRAGLNVAWVDSRCEEPTIQLGSIRLHKLRRLTPLIRFLMGEDVLKLEFTDASPDEEPGRLELQLTGEPERRSTILHFPGRPIRAPSRKARRRIGGDR